MNNFNYNYQLPQTFQKLSTEGFYKNTASILGYENVYFYQLQINGQNFLFAKINNFIEDEHENASRVLKSDDYFEYEAHFHSIHGKEIPLILKQKKVPNYLQGTYVNMLAANVILVKFFNQYKFGDCLQMVYNDMFFNRDANVQKELQQREKAITDKYTQLLCVSSKQACAVNKLKDNTCRIKEETDILLRNIAVCENNMNMFNETYDHLRTMCASVFGDNIAKPDFILFGDMTKDQVLELFANKIRRMIYFMENQLEEAREFEPSDDVKVLYETKFGNIYNPKTLKDFLEDNQRLSVDGVEQEVIVELRHEVQRLCDNHYERNKYITKLSQQIEALKLEKEKWLVPKYHVDPTNQISKDYKDLQRRYQEKVDQLKRYAKLQQKC